MYTPEEREILLKEYQANPCLETVEKLARDLNKPKNSIIGKLVKEEVYQKTTYRTKTGEIPVTKKELVHNIAKALEAPVERLEGLEKAPKAALKLLEQCLSV